MDAEEARLERALAALPAVATRYDDLLDEPDAPARLWRRAVADAQAGYLDDRPLYWARLKLRRERRRRGGRPDTVEPASRGFSATFPSDKPAVLVTGFDPFHLDDEIRQSNPSGLAALALNGTTIAGAHVRAAILPVRFADFDGGLVEAFLAPRFRNGLALAVTVSMGRDRFDLERFPGLRRSAEMPDNRNVYTGASAAEPQVPPGLGSTSAPPEFLEFSLPAAPMAAVEGRWPVRDNRGVRSLERGTFAAESLADLTNDTAVQGSGGGYLSNEIAYRSLLLQERLGVRFPLGHLHTPSVRGYDLALEQEMVDQVRRIIKAALC